MGDSRHKFCLIVNRASANSMEKEVLVSTTRDSADRGEKASASGYTDRTRVLAPPPARTPEESQSQRKSLKWIVGIQPTMPHDPRARSPARLQENPGRRSTSATSHDRAAATAQHLKSRANGNSANPRVCEHVFPILLETTTTENHPDHQEEPRIAENGITTAETSRQINGAPRGVCQQTPGGKGEVRLPETRVHRGAVHAAV